MLRSAFPGLFLKHDVLVPAPVPVPVPIPIPVPLPVPVPIPDSCFSRRPQNTVGIENVTRSRTALRYYRDLTASSLQTYVLSRAVTKQIVTQSRRLVGVQRFKMAKIDPVSPSYPTL